MTTVKPDSPLKRETAATVKGRPLIITLYPGYLTLRERGRRHSVSVEYRAVLDLGYKMLARAAAAEKAERRKGARRAGAR